MNSAEPDLFALGVLARLSRVDAGYNADAVLQDANFEIRTGEVAFVTGPTSAGKTTLMHVLRLALPLRSGSATILGADVGRLNGRGRARLKRRIGYIAENPAFVEEWTGTANIALALRLAGRKAKDYEEDVRELIEFVGLGIAADEPVRQLSGAARRRVAIARALVTKPDLILADDPTAGLSPEAGRRLIRLLAEMRRVGTGVVITSQDESLADCAPGERWRLERGRLSPVDHAATEDVEAYR
jgi:cell division transport system ATP-binding protein